MLIYEMCEKGTLKDFLVANKANVTVDLQDNLYRFGLDIAKGMEHLASKQVHINFHCAITSSPTILTNGKTSFKMLGLYLDILIIGQILCSMLSILNEFEFAKRIAKFRNK